MVGQKALRQFAVLACTAALVFSLSGCTDDGPELRSGNNQAFVEGDGTVTLIDAADREPAPDVTGTTLQDEELSLTDFRGNVVVLNVWASWCGPCRAEADALNEVAQQNLAKGVQFVGLNTQDSETNAAAFEENFGVSYPSLFDPSGQTQLLFTGILPPVAIPSTLIVDKNGDIAARVVGPTDYNELSKLVRDVASEGDDPA